MTGQREAVAEVRRRFVRAALRRARTWRPFVVSRSARCASCGERIGPMVGRWSVVVSGLLNGERSVVVCGGCAAAVPFERPAA